MASPAWYCKQPCLRAEMMQWLLVNLWPSHLQFHAAWWSQCAELANAFSRHQGGTQTWQSELLHCPQHAQQLSSKTAISSRRDVCVPKSLLPGETLWQQGGMALSVHFAESTQLLHSDCVWGMQLQANMHSGSIAPNWQWSSTRTTSSPCEKSVSLCYSCLIYTSTICKNVSGLRVPS